MASVQRITIGPSERDLAQSLLDGSQVDFTLESGETITGKVATLHDHRLEDRLFDNERYEVQCPHDWLIALEEIPTSTEPNKFKKVFVEYKVQPCSGLCYVLTNEEWEVIRDSGHASQYSIASLIGYMMGID